MEHKEKSVGFFTVVKISDLNKKIQVSFDKNSKVNFKSKTQKLTKEVTE